ncbi:coilin [Drosophila montana]|uniref:coilin n=1 Tax=Drosophila montana TaxID=40370 RepID=UPI00313E2587
MHNFPIKVDLSNYFSDARSCSLVLVDVTWENVKELQDHIQKLFYLKDISLLTNDGCYVPPKESIKVIKSAQSLKAFQLDVASKSSRDGVEDPSCFAETTKKRKNRSAESEIELISSTPNLPKRSKCKNVTKNETTFADPAVNINATNGNSEKSVKGNKSKRVIESFEEEPKAPEISCIEHNKSAVTGTAPSTPNQPKNLSSIKKQNNSNNHIIYNNNEEEENEPEVITAVETSCRVEPVVQEVEFRSLLMELDCNSGRVLKLPRKSEPIKIIEEIVIPATKLSMALAAPKENVQLELEPLEAVISAEVVEGGEVEQEEVEQEETKPATPPQLSPERSQEEQDGPELQDNSIAEEPTQSLLDSDSEDDVMVLDDTNIDDSDSDVQPVPVKKDETLDIIADMLKNAAPLTNLPNVGETVIFKLAKSKNAQQPAANTNYIAGTCNYINRRTRTMTIAIIACPNGIRHILHQYSSCLDDSDAAARALTVNFRELIDAKVVVASVD